MSEGMLGNLSLSEVRGPREDLETKLASVDGEEWLDALKRFLRKENPWEGIGLRDAKKEEGEQVPILRAVEQVRVPARTEPFDPIAFFHGKGLWVSAGFWNLILSVAKPIDSVPETTLASFNLVRAAHDAGIRAELPKNHVFEDASAFCTHLAGMILRQPDGELGDLLANGYVNIFYVRGAKGEVRAVSVSWYSGSREWRVYAVRLGDYQWNDGSHVFSSNC